MKIAYLISAYTDPDQLNNLINKLDDKDTRFFIHIDKKVSIKPFLDVISKYPHAKIIKKQILVQWGGFGQVLYQKAMLEEMIYSRILFDRVFIISAQDYPLIPNKEIENELSKNIEKEYITGFNLTKSGNKSQLKNICWYHFFRDLPVKSDTLKKFFSGGARLILRVLPFRKKTYLSINSSHWDIYKSSSYMCLTFECAKFVYEQLCTNKKINSYFRTSYIPEEMVIPTIIFNSVYAKKATLIEESNNLQAISAITYFQYDKAIKVYTLNDYEELKHCNKMFARKFSSKLSKTLMDKLNDDENTLG